MNTAVRTSLAVGPRAQYRYKKKTGETFGDSDLGRAREQQAEHKSLTIHGTVRSTNQLKHMVDIRDVLQDTERTTLPPFSHPIPARHSVFELLYHRCMETFFEVYKLHFDVYGEVKGPCQTIDVLDRQASDTARWPGLIHRGWNSGR